MSGICGIYNTNGEPVATEDLLTMMGSMAHWGPDDSGIWQDGNVALGHLMLVSTPEAEYEKMPCQNESGNLVITADARVDNRDELAERLGIPHSERPRLTDSAFILKAFEKWGVDCPEYILGDYAFAIWDKLNQRLFCAKDYNGGRPLFYHETDKGLIFASSIQAVINHPKVPVVHNDQRIADFLIGNPLPGEMTFYKNVYRLLQGHTITLSSSGTKKRNYWNPQNLTELRLPTDQEYVEAFKEVFFKAVASMLRSNRKIGVMMSGGLDSSSVACVASRLLKKSNKILYAYSSAPLPDSKGLLQSGGIGDETPFIESIGQQEKNIYQTYERAEKASPVESIKNGLKTVGYPVHSPINMYWMEAICERARSDGMGVLLTGQAGNATISWSGSGYLASLLKQKKLKQLLEEFRKSSANDRNQLIGMARFLFRATFPMIPRKLLYTIKKYHDPATFSYAQPWLVSDTNAMTRLEEFIDSTQNRADNRKSRLHYLLENETGDIWSSYCTGFNLEPRDPTADRRVAEFCLSIPEDQYFFNGKSRMLIRRAMSGILPDIVRWNTERGRQAADIHARMVNADDWKNLRNLVDCLKKSAIAKRYINIEKMGKVLAEVSFETASSLRGKQLTRYISQVHFLLRSVLMGMFLMGENQWNLHDES